MQEDSSIVTYYIFPSSPAFFPYRKESACRQQPVGNQFEYINLVFQILVTQMHILRGYTLQYFSFPHHFFSRQGFFQTGKNSASQNKKASYLLFRELLPCSVSIHLKKSNLLISLKYFAASASKKVRMNRYKLSYTHRKSSRAFSKFTFFIDETKQIIHLKMK